MTDARACVIVKRMKKIVCLALIFALVLALAAGFFACKNKEPVVTEKDKYALASLVVDAVFPEGREDKDQIKDALLTLLDDAELEDAEIISVLTDMIDEPDDLAAPLLDLKNNEYSTSHIGVYRTTLQIIANAVSPEMAGRVFYAAASKTAESLPYSMSDCEKISSLFFGDNDLFNVELDLLQGQTFSINERQLNTVMITVVSALRKAVGISAEARTYLRTLAEQAIDGFFASESANLSAETRAAIQQNKEFLLSLTEVFLDNYDDILSFTADYFAQADARLFLGLPYEKQECTTYYGYSYAGWQKTVITKEQYDARVGGYDEYLKIDDTLNGFTVNGAFVSISDTDAALADGAYRLFTAYKAYALLSETQKATFKEVVGALLSVLAREQDAVAAVIDRPLSDTPATATVSIDELISTLPALSAFDATDGVSEEEHNLAQNAVSAFIDYLHGYFPNIIFSLE